MPSSCQRRRRSTPGLPLLVTLGCLSLFSAAVAQDPVTCVVRDTATPCLKVRSDSSTATEPFECISPGTVVTVIASVPYWRKVNLPDGRSGWVAKMYLEPATAPTPGPAPAPPPSDAWLEVHFVDVGQGDGIWIHTFDDGIDGNGKFEGLNIVIDGGPDSSDSTNQMLKYLQAHGHDGAVLDALIVTHPHDDHYPGADGLRRHFTIHDYYDPGYPKQGVAYPAFLAAVQQDQTAGRIGQVHLGKQQFGSLDWGSEITAEILYSYPGSSTGLGSGNTLENNSSIVLRLQYGSRSFLFMGDGEGKSRTGSADQPKYVEEDLLGSVASDKLKSTVLKIGHHGSETSSTVPFITAVDPEIVVVSSGRKNYQGSGSTPVFLPKDSTLRRCCCHNAGIRIYRTDQNDEAEGRTTTDDADGDHIVIRTNGTDLEVKALEAGQPFTVSSCRPGC